MTARFSDSMHDLSARVKAPWRRFLEDCEPLRPELYRYCRYLTRSPWDAEDLAQDTLARAFVTLGWLSREPPNPRAWLFRVASNLWLNRVERRREEPVAVVPERVVEAEPRPAREAAGTLIARLSPQERAAVVLKDVFDLTLEESAEALETTVGAVKAALHRGRGKLEAPDAHEPHVATPAALDAFCAAFNARDLDRVTALLLEHATVEFPGLKVEYGPEAAREGSLTGTLFGCPDGHAPEGELGYLRTAPRAEVRVHRGEAIVLYWWRVGEREAVGSVLRVEVEGERVSRLRNYLHAPELIAEICGELGVPFRTQGHLLLEGAP